MRQGTVQCLAHRRAQEMLLMATLAKLESIYTVTVPGGHSHTFSSFMPFFIQVVIFHLSYFPEGSHSKESGCNAGDPSLVPESGRFPGEGDGYPLQYSCLENPMNRGAWEAAVLVGLQRVGHDCAHMCAHINFLNIPEFGKKASCIARLITKFLR